MDSRVRRMREGGIEESEGGLIGMLRVNSRERRRVRVSDGMIIGLSS